MDPAPSPGYQAGRSGGPRATAAGPPSDRTRRSELLRQHLVLEDQHTRRALAAAGVEAVKQQLLEELRDRYLGEVQDLPPERIGPYYYSIVSGPDGGLLAYTRARAAEPHAAAGAGGVGGEGQRRLSAVRPEGPREVLLSRDMVTRDARVASQLTGLRLGDSVGALKLCPRHRLLAYSLPLLDRPDVFCVLVRDTAPGQLVLPGGVVGCVAGPGGMELAADGRSLLVLGADPAGRPAQVVLHDLRCASPPRLLLTETDPRFFLALGRTKDWALLLINSNSKTSSEVHVLDAADPASSPPRLIQRRTPGLEYFVEHHRPRGEAPTPQWQTGGGGGGGGGGEGQLIILTNADLGALRGGGGGSNGGDHGGGGGFGSSGRELSVVVAPLSRPGLEHWRPLLGGRPGVVVTDMDVFEGCVVLYERRQGLPAVSVLPLTGLAAENGGAGVGSSMANGNDGGGGDGDDVALRPLQVPLPPWALHVAPGANADPHSPTLRLAVSSPLHPPAVLDYHLNLRTTAATATTTSTFPGSPGPHSRPGRLQLLARPEPPPPAAEELLRRCSLVQLMVESTAPDEAADGEGGSGAGDGRDVVRVPVTLVLPPGVTFPAAGQAGAGGGGGFSWRLISGPCQHEGALDDDDGGGASAPAEGLSTASGVDGGSARRSGSGGCGGDAAYSESVGLRSPASTSTSTPESPVGGAAGGDGWPRVGGPRPLLLSVYGAYGMPLELQYDPSLLCLLARGWAVAKVHVRGGGELGRGWHAAGCRHRKRAAVEDCLAALRVLTANTGPGPGPDLTPTLSRWGTWPASPPTRPPQPTSSTPARGGGRDEGATAAASGAAAPLTAPGLVAGHAISAGGVVLGAALNAAPGVFGAAVLRCAFLELLGSCSDASQPLTAHEWDEWGDPADPRDWEALGQLCPYRNLLDRPGGDGDGDGDGAWRAAVLASCAEEDPRVHPSIPAKWVARLRDRLRRTHPRDLYENDDTAADDERRRGDSRRDGGGDGGGGGGDSPWSHLLGRLWGSSRGGTNAAKAQRGAAAGSTKPKTSSHGPEGAAAAASGTDGLGDGGGGSGGGGDSDACTRGASGGAGGGVRRRGVCAPLLRVHFDGAGHVRGGHAEQTEEVVEEMAFMLVALSDGAGADGRDGAGGGRSGNCGVGGADGGGSDAEK